jgi:hypothetical protein
MPTTSKAAWEPTSTLQRALSGRFDSGTYPEAEGIVYLYNAVSKAADKTLLQRYTASCEQVIPWLINGDCLRILVECHLTPVDLRDRTSECSVIDGILNLCDYPMLAQQKLLLLEYVLVGDQLWRRGFQK